MLCLLGIGLLTFFSCVSDRETLLTFSITETGGLDRPLEYVTVRVPVHENFDASRGIGIREIAGDSVTAAQILDTLILQSGQKILHCLFPVSIQANSTRTFHVVNRMGSLYGDALKYDGGGINITIENDYFIADLTDKKATAENGLGSGQLAGLTLKKSGNKLLERRHINMHWAPNFQKEELDYKTFGHILNPDSLGIIRGPYSFSLYRSGSIEGYDEILVKCRYDFYAGLPYFLFSSEILIRQDVALFLLRNDEMTMDSLFTHVIYPDPDDMARTIDLYDGEGIDMLEEDPIPDDVPWLYFNNEPHGYAFGSIRLKYDNTNLDGQPSPLYKEHTKISRSTWNGRYWNRRLIHDQVTLIPQGSRYQSENAYLVFSNQGEDASGIIRKYRERLLNPLQIKYLED